MRRSIAGLRTHARSLCVLAGSCLLAGAAQSDRLLAQASHRGPVLSSAILFFLCLLIVPARLFPLAIVLAAALAYGAERVNALKVAAVGLPLTTFDLYLVVRDPAMLVNAAGLRRPLLIALAAATLVAVGVFVKARQKRRRTTEGPTVRVGRETVLRVAAGVLLLLAAQVTMVRYGAFVHANLATLYPELLDDLWEAPSQVALADALGVPEYLAFSYAAGDADLDVDIANVQPPSGDEVRQAARQIVQRYPAAEEQLPNIVFFHAESTFDPNSVFRLSRQVDSPLWSRTSDTAAVGRLRVNVIGGGSWVTEFEVITGIDSRVFGYQGFYTHRYLAPLAKTSFVGYLASKGYSTAAYYPVGGDFFNTEEAFRAYGFQHFVGGDAMGLPEDWSRLVDREIIKRMVERGAFERRAPFFLFLSTSENHGPHNCRDIEPGADLPVRFDPAADFQQNCRLNEFLQRAASTADGFELVAEELRKVSSATGRPYVLLAYGDHQPWSLTDGSYAVAGGEAKDRTMPSVASFRTSPGSSNMTFFHLRSTVMDVVTRDMSSPPPAALLPTLVSAYVAQSEDDLYLPPNFLAYVQCGSDFRRSDCALRSRLEPWLRQTLFSGRATLATMR